MIQYHLNKRLKTLRPQLLLLMAIGLSIVPFAYVINNFLSVNFEVVLGVICFPFVFTFVRTSGKTEPRSEWKYLLLGGMFLGFYLGLGVNTLAFFAAGFGILYLTENSIGKLSNVVWVYLFTTSPFFQFIVNAFSFPLRLQLTKLAAMSLQLFDKGITSSGNIIFKEGYSFRVDPECMGLNSISFCLTICLLTVSFYQKQQSKRSISFFNLMVLLLITSIFAVIANYFRIIGLVVFSSMPNTLSHELIGLACIVTYGVVPVQLILKKHFKPTNTTVVNQVHHIITQKKHVVISILYSALVMVFIHFAPPSSHVKKDESFHNISLSGFSKKTVEHNVLKLESENALIYVKPSVNFYGAHHAPLLCWTGSGYQANSEQDHELETLSYSTASLSLKQDTLYSAWWFDNGSQKTCSQWDWRLDMLKGSEPYRLVNVTCKTPEQLQTQIQKILTINLIKTKP